ncbi:glycosyltransferase involved in cell wall biosynthesis [Flavobacterium sp. W4I14]|nr:glycosyltransferase involved in cell wall biosynthesis [Flavobacterium sp. W4I14]
MTIKSINKKICIVTQSHLSRNPRVVKEAISLSRAGYSVTILTSIYDNSLLQQDLALLKGETIEVRLISDLSKRNYRSLIDRSKRKFAMIIKKWCDFESPHALGYGINRYLKACLNLRADLYICHQEAATYIGNQLMAKGLKVAYDFEDWYSTDLLPRARAKRPLRLLRKIEENAIQNGLFSYTASHALATAFEKTYHGKKPHVIYNVFPKPTGLNEIKKIGNGKINTFWFSQVVGQGRGIETFIKLINFFKQGIAVHLLGDISPDFKSLLMHSIVKKHDIVFHKMVTPEELPIVIARFDIGLALENNMPVSRNLTITNKFFQYLQSELPIICSPTDGQLEIFNLNSPGYCLSSEITETEALKLEEWLQSAQNLADAKRNAQLVAEVYNWQNEEKKLTELIESYI